MSRPGWLGGEAAVLSFLLHPALPWHGPAPLMSQLPSELIPELMLMSAEDTAAEAGQA